MPKVARPWTAIQVKQASKPGYHAVGTVPGLYLQVTESGAKSWVLRVKVGKRRPEIGLGGYPAVTLAAAHDKAREERANVQNGIDPVEQRKEARSRLLAAQTAGWTFQQCAEAFIAEHEFKWKNAKHAAQWRSTLATYAYPLLGNLLVRHVETPHVLGVLRPIWNSITETADRVRGRIKQIIDWAIASGYRTGPNPANWEGHLDKVLPSPNKVKTPKRHPHVAVENVREFMRELHKREGIGARALEFLVLTAVRSANVRKASWSEIDIDKRVWIIPGQADADSMTGQRMKGGSELMVPLSPAAVDLLATLPRMHSELVFPSERGKVMSDMTLLEVMRRMKVDAVPHGFRFTFKTWASENTNHPREVIEAALGHKLKDKVEAAYMRGNWLDKRRLLMEEWATFLDGLERDSNVVSIGSVARAAA